MAENLSDLRDVLAKMESLLSQITELDSEVLDFIDAKYPDLLNDQKIVQTIKGVTDAEDELQRQFKFLSTRLGAAIPDLK
jgi:hypothetical protein